MFPGEGGSVSRYQAPFKHILPCFQSDYSSFPPITADIRVLDDFRRIARKDMGPVGMDLIVNQLLGEGEAATVSPWYWICHISRFMGKNLVIMDAPWLSQRSEVHTIFLFSFFPFPLFGWIIWVVVNKWIYCIILYVPN